MTVPRTLFLTTIIVLGPLVRARADTPPLSPSAPRAERTVILARGLDADQTLILATALAATDHPGVLLLDTPGARAPNRRFLAEFKPAAVVTVGPAGDGDGPGHVAWDGAHPETLWEGLFPTAARVVVAVP